MESIPRNASVVIIGAGCFGVSTAWHLLSRGYTDVTVIDRSTTLPAADAASNDISRIVRSSYADKFYSELVRESISSWKKREIWGDTYHASGVIILGLSDKEAGDTHTYADDSYRNDVDLGCSVDFLATESAIRACFPPQVPTSSFDHCSGYLNRDGGWVNASEAMVLLLKQVMVLKGKIIPNKKVIKLHPSDSEKSATEIHCGDSTVLKADVVIVATGSWSASAFPELFPDKVCLAIGQCTATVQLSQTEAERYRRCPVVLDFNTSFYIFPPNDENIMKLGTHAAGYTHFEGNDTISSPRTITTDPENGLLIPKAALVKFREHLGKIYPELVEKPFRSTRLCWYNDTADENWIIGRHPVHRSIFLATGGSGHAFKFLPVIGGLVADVMENKLSHDLVRKFALNRHRVSRDGSRSGNPVPLDLNRLCGIQDMVVNQYK